MALAGEARRASANPTRLDYSGSQTPKPQLGYSLPVRVGVPRLRAARGGILAVLVALLLLLLTFLGVTPAYADTIFTPYVGRAFGPSDEVQAETLGISIASMAGGVIGFETDYARIADAPDTGVFAGRGRITTIFGNLMVGLPLGPARPYVAGGLGWLRAEETDRRTDGIAVGAGGGVMGFIGPIGARIDVRYVRGVAVGGGLRDFELSELGFWKTSVGLAIRF